MSNAKVIGRSNQVPFFLISLGARLRINFLLGTSIPQFLKVPLILSFASLIVISGKPIISIVGSALLESASIVISCPISPTFVKVLINCTMQTLSNLNNFDIKIFTKKSRRNYSFQYVKKKIKCRYEKIHTMSKN